MSQETELGMLGLSRLGRRNLVIFGYILCVGLIVYLLRAIERKDNVIEADRKEIIKCKDDLAQKVEQLMNQTYTNSLKGDQILERLSVSLERQRSLQETVDQLRNKKR